MWRRQKAPEQSSALGFGVYDLAGVAVLWWCSLAVAFIDICVKFLRVGQGSKCCLLRSRFAKINRPSGVVVTHSATYRISSWGSVYVKVVTLSFPPYPSEWLCGCVDHDYRMTRRRHLPSIYPQFIPIFVLLTPKCVIEIDFEIEFVLPPKCSQINRLNMSQQYVAIRPNWFVDRHTTAKPHTLLCGHSW